MDILFRPAHASDVEAAVPLIYSAAPEALEYLYTAGDKTAHDFLHYAFLEAKGLYGWRNHTVATINDQVVGIGAFFSGQEYRSLTQTLMMQMLRYYPKIVLPRLTLHSFHLAQIIAPPPLHCHFLMDFGVATEKRSQGVGTAFIRHHLALAQQLGRDSLGLDVAVTNLRAQALYDRLGFEMVMERKFKGKNGAVPDSRRMIMMLDTESNI
jgi:GNAT superfamily N-acetyltransferase